MRIIRNSQYVRTKKRNGRLLAALGFLLLISTFALTLVPNLFLFSYVFLIVGFLLFSQGMRDITKWNRPVRNDQVLDRVLAKLGDQYTMIHFSKIGRRMIEHMMVFPGGVMVFTTKEYFGQVTVRGRRWRQGGLGLRRLLGLSGPQLGNPSVETDAAISSIEQYLQNEQYEADIHGVVVFVDPRAAITAEEPDYPILLPDELAGYVQEESADELGLSDRQRLVELLGGGGTLENAPAPNRRRPVVRRRAS